MKLPEVWTSQYLASIARFPRITKQPFFFSVVLLCPTMSPIQWLYPPEKRTGLCQ